MHIKQERRCVACRSNKPQNEMLRFAKIDGNIMIDEKNKLGGRGAYICKSHDCIQLAIKKKCLNKAFKMNVDNSVYEKIVEYEKNN